MEKMRVSAMKITRRGQTPVEEPLPADYARDSPKRESLRARMREVAQKYRRKAEQAMKDFPPRRAHVRSERFARASGQTGRVRHARGDKGSGQDRPWRYDFLIQTGVCAMVLVSVAVFRAIDTPLTNEITDGITEVVTMDVDVGKDIGRLQFVRNIVPESVLTFWENTSEHKVRLISPFDGAIAAGFSDEQPGVIYSGKGNEVRSAAAGVVASVREAEGGGYILRIRHDDGVDTLYGLLRGVKVAQGDAVEAGQQIALALEGNAGYHLYFQVLEAGKAVDPSELMTL